MARLEIPHIRILITCPYLALFERSSLVEVLGQLIDIFGLNTRRALNKFRGGKDDGTLRVRRQA
jgi:hypothetical protein